MHRASKGKRGARRLPRADQPAPVSWTPRKSLSQHPRLDRSAIKPPRTIRRKSPGRRAVLAWRAVGSRLGAIAAIAPAVGCLGATAALDGPHMRSMAPSSTTFAAPTTVSTVASLTWTTAPHPRPRNPLARCGPCLRAATPATTGSALAAATAGAVTPRAAVPVPGTVGWRNGCTPTICSAFPRECAGCGRATRSGCS